MSANLRQSEHHVCSRLALPISTATIGQCLEAKISILDWGFPRSDATYDVVHVWQRRFFRLDRHLDRFLNSVHRLHMTFPLTDRD